MARRSRVHVPLLHHVMYCGNQRQIRFEPIDKRYGFVLYAYVFVSNHVRVVK